MKIKSGSTNVSVYYYVVQDASGTSPGEPVTGLLFSDIETGGSASYVRQGAARTDLTLITLASASAAHADGGFILVDDTNTPGLYRCDYPDAAFVTGVSQTFLQIVVASGKNAVAAPILVDIDDNVDQTVDNNTKITIIDTVADAILVDTADMQPKVAKIPLSDGTVTWNATARASINTECDTALADYDGPTNAEMIARTRLDADYFSWDTDNVAVVTLVNTLTTYTGNTPQTADHTSSIADIPTVSEFNARTLVAASYFDSTADNVIVGTIGAGVITATSIAASALDGKGNWNIGKTGYSGTATNMRGTDNSLLAASYTAPDNTGIAQTQVDIGNLNDITVVEILTTQMTESYAADGVAPTLAQALFNVQQNLSEFAYVGTTKTTKKIDGSTTAATYTLDDAVNPTSSTRTT